MMNLKAVSISHCIMLNHNVTSMPTVQNTKLQVCPHAFSMFLPTVQTRPNLKSEAVVVASLHLETDGPADASSSTH